MLALLATESTAAGPGYVVTLDSFEFRGWNAHCSRLRELYPVCSAYRQVGNRCLAISFSRHDAHVGYPSECGDIDEAARSQVALPLSYRDTNTSAAITALVNAHGNRSARRRINADFLENADILAALLFRITNEPD